VPPGSTIVIGGKRAPSSSADGLAERAEEGKHDVPMKRSGSEPTSDGVGNGQEETYGVSSSLRQRERESDSVIGRTEARFRTCLGCD
jgi:hypothetical protein